MTEHTGILSAEDTQKTATVLNLVPKLEEKKEEDQKAAEKAYLMAIATRAQESFASGQAAVILLVLNPDGLHIQSNVTPGFGMGMLGMANDTFMEMFRDSVVPAELEAFAHDNDSEQQS